MELRVLDDIHAANGTISLDVLEAGIRKIKGYEKVQRKTIAAVPLWNPLCLLYFLRLQPCDFCPAVPDLRPCFFLAASLHTELARFGMCLAVGTDDMLHAHRTSWKRSDVQFRLLVSHRRYYLSAGLRSLVWHQTRYSMRCTSHRCSG